MYGVFAVGDSTIFFISFVQIPCVALETGVGLKTPWFLKNC